MLWLVSDKSLAFKLLFYKNQDTSKNLMDVRLGWVDKHIGRMPTPFIRFLVVLIISSEVTLLLPISAIFSSPTKSTIRLYQLKQQKKYNQDYSSTTIQALLWAANEVLWSCQVMLMWYKELYINVIAKILYGSSRCSRSLSQSEERLDEWHYSMTKPNLFTVGRCWQYGLCSHDSSLARTL